MRVALVSPQYPPQLGGVEHHVQQLAVHLVRGGDDVDVLTLAAPGEASTSLVDGVTVRRIPAFAGRSHLPVSWGIAAALRARPYDVVHAHNYHSLLPLAASRAAADRLVLTPHYHGRSASRVRGALLRAYRPVGRQVCARARRIICVSAAERALAISDLGVPAERVVVLGNGVDVERLRVALPYPEERPVVLSLGRLEHYKRVDRLIDAFRHVHGDAQLVVLGDGPARHDLERAARSVPGDRVRLLGRVSDDAVARWLVTARVVASLSELEAFGLTLLEGAVAGAAVVASDIPAHHDVADQTGGAVRLVPLSATAEALARTVETALAAPPAAPLQARSWADVASATREVYAQVAAERAAS